jgi:hypothetical protein
MPKHPPIGSVKYTNAVGQTIHRVGPHNVTPSQYEAHQRVLADEQAVVAADAVKAAELLPVLGTATFQAVQNVGGFAPGYVGTGRSFYPSHLSPGDVADGLARLLRLNAIVQIS